MRNRLSEGDPVLETKLTSEGFIWLLTTQSGRLWFREQDTGCTILVVSSGTNYPIGSVQSELAQKLSIKNWNCVWISHDNERFWMAETKNYSLLRASIAEGVEALINACRRDPTNYTSFSVDNPEIPAWLMSFVQEVLRALVPMAPL